MAAGWGEEHRQSGASDSEPDGLRPEKKQRPGSRPHCAWWCMQTIVPGDKATKIARIRAHAAFDTVWKGRKMTRKDAYKWMQQVLRLKYEEAHIAMFDSTTCERLIEAVDRWKLKPF